MYIYIYKPFFPFLDPNKASTDTHREKTQNGVFYARGLTTDRTTALRERTNQFVVAPIYFHSSLPVATRENEPRTGSLLSSLSRSRLGTFLFTLVSFFLFKFHSRLPGPDDETEAHVNTLIAVNRYSLSSTTFPSSSFYYEREKGRERERERREGWRWTNVKSCRFIFVRPSTVVRDEKRKLGCFVFLVFRALPSIARLSVCVSGNWFTMVTWMIVDVQSFVDKWNFVLFHCRISDRWFRNEGNLTWFDTIEMVQNGTCDDSN